MKIFAVPAVVPVPLWTGALDRVALYCLGTVLLLYVIEPALFPDTEFPLIAQTVLGGLFSSFILVGLQALGV